MCPFGCLAKHVSKRPPTRTHPTKTKRLLQMHSFIRDIQKKSKQNIKNSVIGNGKIFGFIQFFGQAFAKTSVAEPRARGTAHLRFENRVSLKPISKTVLGDRFPKSAAFRS